VRKKKKWLGLLLILLLPLLLNGQSAYDKAVEAYRLSRLDEAESLLGEAKSAEPSRDDIYLLLGAVYQKQNRFPDAEAALKEGMSLFGAGRDNLAYNLANLYYSRNRRDDALSLYTQISEGQSSFRAGATLNRANCYLSLGDYPSALTDYTDYLALEPSTPQRESIEKMISLLNRKIADEADRVKQAADQAALAEARKQEAERQAAEEAARQQALLDEILASLEGASGETQVIGAGSEDIVIGDEESDIEE
jgi:tetratricopeptide (TPR) repeat protein